MKDKIFIGTSISTHNLEIQKIAIKSWIEAGFGVISCNCKDEITILKKEFKALDVEFKEIELKAGKISKPQYLPYISEIMETLSDKGGCICGMSNSDIIFSKIDSKTYNYIYDESKESIVFVHRCDIDSYKDIEEMNWSINHQGIDTFFIDKSKAHVFDESELFIQSCWDVFLPIIAKNNGVCCKNLVLPIAFHIEHGKKWNVQTMINVCDYMCNNEVKSNSLEYFVSIRNELYYSYVQNISMSLYYERNDYKFYDVNQIESDELYRDVVCWIFERYECSKLYIIPILLQKKEDSDYYYFSELNYKKAVRNKLNKIEKILVAEKLRKRCKEVIINLGCFYKRLEELSMIIESNISSYYLCPAGQISKRWVVENIQKLGEENFSGFLDNYKTGERIFKIGIDIGKSTIIVLSRKYCEELEKQLFELYGEQRVLIGDLITDVGSGYIKHI